MPRKKTSPDVVQREIETEYVRFLLDFDGKEIIRLSTLIRKFGRVPEEHRDKRFARNLDYWRHARGYLRWRVANLSHPGKSAPVTE